MALHPRADRKSDPLLIFVFSALVSAVAVFVWLAGGSSSDTIDAQEAQQEYFPDGVYDVGYDIMPGTYVAEDIRETCYAQLMDYQIVRRNFSFVGRAILTIRLTDVEFYSTACGSWIRIPDASETEPETEFGQGAYRIGIDIEPGVYAASENDGRCFWYTVPDFTYQFVEEPFIYWWREGAAIAEIDDDATGFYSVRCGEWTKLPDSEFTGRKRRFDDGSYLVRRELVPGTYVSPNEEGICTWLRVVPFTSLTGDQGGSDSASGQQIVTILKNDYGFYSSGCGEWQPLVEDRSASPSERFGQGTFIVGLDIAPGTYVAESVDGRFCRWTTLSEFTGRPRDVSASGIGVIRGIVKLSPEERGFKSVGCEEWVLVPDEFETQPATTFGEGEFIVGFHVAPGTYEAPGANAGRCLWRRLNDFTGRFGEVTSTRNVVGRVIAKIEDGDAGFETYRCGEWVPFEVDDADPSPATEFGLGTWAVNIEVSPGTYVAEVPEGSQCFWSRLSGFGGEASDFISIDTTPIHAVMTLTEYDVGVYSDGCGTWRLITDPASSPEAGEIPDGVYIVGRDVAPGTYVATRQGQGQCYWSRVTSFRGDLYERIASYGAAGQAIVTIKEEDIGFRSWNCGTWTPFDPASQEMLSSFADGTYAIGADLEPGTYHVRDATAVCNWRRMSDFSWNEGILADVRDSGRAIVTVLESDIAFYTKDCGEWVPLVPESDAEMVAIPEGTFVVGTEVPPGTYASQPWPTGRCEWARLSDFTGEDDAVISRGSSEGPAIVTVEEGDAGFFTKDCRDWVLLADGAEAEVAETMESGVYRVGIDIQPGTYRAETSSEVFNRGEFVPACTWRRLSGFTHEGPDDLEAGFDRGTHIVTIEPSDVGFTSENCGTWERVGPGSG